MTLAFRAEHAKDISQTASERILKQINEDRAMKFNWIWDLIQQAAEEGKYFLSVKAILSAEECIDFSKMLMYYDYKVTPVSFNPGTFDIRWN